MSELQEINSFFQKPESTTRQSFVLKGINTSSTCTKKCDLDRLLELLNITNDITLQLKVFSAISAYLMFNKGANINVIIKCNAVYDKIHSVLSVGLPRKSTEALNFLSALLYIDADDGTTNQRTLAIYARNMTRVSGCLAAMCEMFTECMLYHDTWKALCQCLAVACNGCEMNQSYCSHLVPVCIQKCSQVNIDILLVLQSLLLNHDKNNQIFLDCNGVNIFTRELLHYDKCLQLLTTVVQNSKISSLMQRTNVMADLRDFLRLYGPNSQLGQKAIIILNHINSSAKGKEPHKNIMATETEMCSNQSPIEMVPEKKSPLQNDLNANTENDFEETNVLIQNVMKEVFNWKQNELLNLNKTESKPVLSAMNRGIRPSITREQKFTRKDKAVRNKTHRLIHKRTNGVNKKLETTRRKAFHCNTASDLSFSFLQNDHFKASKSDKTNRLTQKRTNEVNQMLDATKRKAFQCNTASDLSFSFLQNDHFKVPKSYKTNRLTQKRTNEVNQMMDTTKRKEFQCNIASVLSFSSSQNDHFKVPKRYKINKLTQQRSNEANQMMDTTKRKEFQCNIASELSFSSSQNDHFKVPKRYKISKLTQQRSNEANQMMDTTKRKEFQCKFHESASELSFSFLQNDDFQVPKRKDTVKRSNKMHRNDTQTLNIDDTQPNDTILDRTISDGKQAITSLKDFRPMFASTPKQTTVNTITVNSNKTSESQANQNKYNNLKKKRRNAKQKLQKKNGMKNRSLGAKFFSAINESCTTFVKTVKNLFNKKEPSYCSRSSSSNPTENTIVKDKRPNTYSFTNYMKNRDAVLNNNWKGKITDPSEFSTEANSCKTCDDTEVLKHKLTKDEFLKKTVKKLKLGINLYGCDFKKISNTMWPRETYMTPLVLYNLYRKLLLK